MCGFFKEVRRSEYTDVNTLKEVKRVVCVLLMWNCTETCCMCRCWSRASLISVCGCTALTFNGVTESN